MTEPMKLRVRVKAPLKESHQALTDDAALRTWLADEAEVELPDRYEFWGRHIPEGEAPRQRLLHVDDRTLRFAWTLDGKDTTVEFALAEEGPDSTVVTFTQTDLPGYPEVLTTGGSGALMHTFWALSLANLADHLEGRELTSKCDYTSPEMRAETFIDAPAGAVFDSIVDPAQFRRWFGAHVDIEPRVGGRFAMGGFDADPAPAKITELEPGRRLSLAWDEGVVCSWELAESQGRTRLTFVQSGFDPNDPPHDSWAGWLAGLPELRRYHEVPDWRPIWLEVSVEGMPQDMITYE